jgi:hypothetical protein
MNLSLKHISDSQGSRLISYFTLMEDEIATNSYNRMKKPITPAEKLALTLK